MTLWLRSNVKHAQGCIATRNLRAFRQVTNCACHLLALALANASTGA